MSRYQGTSESYDGGRSRLRGRRRGRISAATTRKVVEKRYAGRLPVSGQEPARLTRYELERAEGRAA